MKLFTGLIIAWFIVSVVGYVFLVATDYLRPQEYSIVMRGAP
jgi:hypothetical protein